MNWRQLCIPPQRNTTCVEICIQLKVARIPWKPIYDLSICVPQVTNALSNLTLSFSRLGNSNLEREITCPWSHSGLGTESALDARHCSTRLQLPSLLAGRTWLERGPGPLPFSAVKSGAAPPTGLLLHHPTVPLRDVGQWSGVPWTVALALTTRLVPPRRQGKCSAENRMCFPAKSFVS